MMTYRSKNEYCSINEYFVSHLADQSQNASIVTFLLISCKYELGKYFSHLYIDRLIVTDFFKPFLHKYTLLFTRLN